MGPSRADTAGDWGAMRKFTPGAGPSEGRPGGYGGFRDREAPREGGFREREPREFRPSAADEVDNWGATRKFEPGAAPGPRREPREGGFRDGPGLGDSSRADAEDQWSRGREFKPTGDSPAGPRPARGPSSDPNDRADKEDRWTRKAPPAGEEAPSSSQPAAGERPKLNLKPRTAAAADAAAAPAAGGSKGSNPFGAARPREEVLKEKVRAHAVSAKRVFSASCAPWQRASHGEGAVAAAHAHWAAQIISIVGVPYRAPLTPPPPVSTSLPQGIDPIKEQLKAEHGDVKR